MSAQFNFNRLPHEIISIVMNHLPLKDLVRIERTSKLIQDFCLEEIEHRMSSGSAAQEWGLMIHLGQTIASPSQFDPKTKTIAYSVPMDPVNINTMFDHRRQIHCSLLRRIPSTPNYNLSEPFVITIQKGMAEGHTEQLDIQGKLCQVQASITRLVTPSQEGQDDKNKKLILAPAPLTYALQVTQMRLPLSTLATVC
ncbi:hypothetical protein J3Q64DRAFT_1734637 [Phycomyces blakesleeanus]|uniref:F-box domain-containing protein n=2 Tax=Phycomyces blakesleeanus TaxID=4837 RepID=A0A167NF53_PHYB8|nr:hypothetical protein PHYBLDRAFT_75845 [Phycomyces blakesleeanus NRRL 1555(-)]OAD75758.1 hypothetical protein PHYBLDRAFT_75845 [Phycomyces blakesleeanus NRRL 1555(-)]|eukprot:XP_018293798.1 hypothetical protein PHYBLDRAFT_75845 [Phycomyces blakesleeanus NRRL 1555(-)]